MPTSTFPNQELQSWFQNLNDSVSDYGYSDNLAVCDQRPIIDLYTHRHLFQNTNIEMLIVSLYESMDSAGCDHPYTVVDKTDLISLKEYLSN
jgi:hypothetical protein